jgi:hypothetical protein
MRRRRATSDASATTALPSAVKVAVAGSGTTLITLLE